MIALRRPTLLLTLAALMAAAIAATPAQAAKRKVPFGFFGTVAPPELTSPGAVTDPILDQQMAAMARAGVESIRITLAWGDIEPSRGRYSFENVDRLVRAAAVHRLQLLFNVTETPRWASSRPNSDFWKAPPKNPGVLGATLRAYAQRYGPGGSFWAANPGIPVEPVRRWQIWNEENAPWHWAARRWAPGYVKLLKAAYQGIKSVDRGATVVAGSFVAAPNTSQWAGVRALYRAGGKRYMDEIAVHPFTNYKTVQGTINQMIDIVTRVRKETRRAHDGRVPISLTEVSWPASVGKIPKRALLGIETTTKGQNARLRAGYKRLVKLRRKLRVTHVLWYTWATQYDRDSPASVMSFRYAGLTRIRSNGVFSPMPLLRTYTSLARKYQGCRKTADARACQ
jgi:hypothetical protein